MKISAWFLGRSSRLETLEANLINKDSPRVFEVKFHNHDYDQQRLSWEQLRKDLIQEDCELVKFSCESDEAFCGEDVGWIFKSIVSDEEFTVIEDWRGKGTYIILDPKWGESTHIIHKNPSKPDKYGRLKL